MTKLSKNESSLIFSIYNTRHNVNEVLLILPWLIAVAFTLIGAPIIAVLCDLPILWNIALFLGPLILATAFLFLRKKIIFTRFLKEKNIENKVEISACTSDMYAANDGDRVLVFENSENMPLILYNWFNGLGVLKGEVLKLCRLLYDNRAVNYIAVSLDDLKISEEISNEFEKETAKRIRLSDIDEMGRIVNVSVYSRMTNKKSDS